MKPALVATLQERLRLRRAPLMVPVPLRSVRFIRSSRTGSVMVHSWPGRKVIEVAPERLASSTHRSPRELVTWNARSPRDPGLASARSRVVRDSVVAMGDVTLTVVLEVTEYVPAKAPGPRWAAAGAATSTSAPRVGTDRCSVRQIIPVMVRLERNRIKPGVTLLIGFAPCCDAA